LRRRALAVGARFYRDARKRVVPLPWLVEAYRAEGVCRHCGCVRRCADGVSPSGVSTLDERRRLRVPPIVTHASPRRTAAEGAGRRKTQAGVNRMSPGGALHSPVAVGFHALDSSSLRCSASSAPEAERFRTAGLSPSARGVTQTLSSKLRPFRGRRRRTALRTSVVTAAA
jgi:hypothetical protein